MADRAMRSLVFLPVQRGYNTRFAAWYRAILAHDLVLQEFHNCQRRLPITNALRTCQPNQAPSTALPLLYSTFLSPTSAMAKTVLAAGPGHVSRMYAATMSRPLVIPAAQQVSFIPLQVGVS